MAGETDIEPGTGDPFAVTEPPTRVELKGSVAAVFSDVHGNLPALQAVLADCWRRGASTLVCGGDLVG